MQILNLMLHNNIFTKKKLFIIRVYIYIYITFKITSLKMYIIYDTDIDNVIFTNNKYTHIGTLPWHNNI